MTHQERIMRLIQQLRQRLSDLSQVHASQVFFAVQGDARARACCTENIFSLKDELQKYPPGIIDIQYLDASFEIVIYYFLIQSPMRAWDYFAEIDKHWRRLHDDDMSATLIEREVAQYHNFYIRLFTIGPGWDKSNISTAVQAWIKPMLERVEQTDLKSPALMQLVKMLKHGVLAFSDEANAVALESDYPELGSPPPDYPSDASDTSDVSSSRLWSPIGLFLSAPTTPSADDASVKQRRCKSAPPQGY